MSQSNAFSLGGSEKATTPDLKIDIKALGNRVFLKWFAIVNAGVLVTTVFWLGTLALVFPILGTAGAFLGLWFSRWLAARAHDITIIDPAKFRSDRERALHGIVSDLAHRAGLPVPPAVGVYPSTDVNAFATGPSRSKAMIAFSSALLDTLPEDEIRAVAAHEISHIACRDMLVMVLLQGIVNTIILAATIPIALLNRITNRGDSYSWLWDMLLRLVRGAAAVVLAFLGSLAVNAFSRHREYRADALAAQLVGAVPMIAVLRRIGEGPSTIPARQMAYAALKFAGRPLFLEWFSTHPATERRIAALELLGPTAAASAQVLSAEGAEPPAAIA